MVHVLKLQLLTIYFRMEEEQYYMGRGFGPGGRPFGPGPMGGVSFARKISFCHCFVNENRT